MSQSQENQDEFTLQVNKDKLFNDVLKFILTKTLKGDSADVLKRLETVVFERWAAIEADNEKKSLELETVERALIEKLLAMGAQKS
jgi:hypothetical protein